MIKNGNIQIKLFDIIIKEKIYLENLNINNVNRNSIFINDFSQITSKPNKGKHNYLNLKPFATILSFLKCQDIFSLKTTFKKSMMKF